MEKLRLELTFLLPDMPEDDDCVELLDDYLLHTRGILESHVVRENGTAELCLHFDPNLLPLGRVERLAKEAGAQITSRYRHEEIPFTGLTAADSASGLTDHLSELPGMLHAQVNYAAGLAFVAYDSTQLQHKQIMETMERWGALAKIATAQEKPTRDAAPTEREGGHGHDHGSAPAFLPHWMQERWTLLLVAAAGIFLAVGFFGERFFGLPAQVALVFYLLAYVAGGYDVATHALPGLLRGQFDTDVLMLAAAAGAALLGEWVEGAFLLFLFALGHAGEHYALDRARNAVSALGALMPKTAQVRAGDQLREIPVEAVEIGQIVVVRPGDRVPVDGEVSAGISTIDQSPVTGESVPVEKEPGDEVFAGTINQDAALDVRVTKLAQDNTLSRVMQMVQEAQSQQSPTQQFTQRFTRWFVPAVLIFTVLVAVAPPLLGWDSWASSFYRAMLLLVAASPCALALGTPAAVLAGIAQAARNGVLIKGGVHLENLGSLRVIAFDKTGTITQGKFEVVDVLPLNGSGEIELLQVAAAVEQQSNHPLALAVVRAAQNRGLEWPGADGLENVPGRGVRSVVAGEPVWIGSLKLFRESDSHQPNSAVVEIVNDLEAQGRSTMIVSRNGRFFGVLGLADVTRPNVSATMRQLRTLGMEHLVMLTGDNKSVAEQIAAEVGLTDVRADLLPEQKLEAVKQLMEQYGPLAMVGDGVNDAPALATATVGLAMGGAGTAVALETADVALMADDVGKLPFAVGLSRASRAIIRQNLAVSLGVIGLLIAASVFNVVGLSGAVILHEGSTIVVVINALRLLRYEAK